MVTLSNFEVRRGIKYTRNERKAMRTPIAAVILLLSMITGVHTYRLAKAFGKSQPAVLQYVKILYKNGYLIRKNEDKRVLYYFNVACPKAVEEIEPILVKPFSEFVKIKKVWEYLLSHLCESNKEAIEKAYEIYKKEKYSDEDHQQLLGIGKEVQIFDIHFPIEDFITAFRTQLDGQEQEFQKLRKRKILKKEEEKAIENFIDSLREHIKVLDEEFKMALKTIFDSK